MFGMGSQEMLPGGLKVTQGCKEHRECHATQQVVPVSGRSVAVMQAPGVSVYTSGLARLRRETVPPNPCQPAVENRCQGGAVN